MIKEKILILHPLGKGVRNISLAAYNMHKNAIVSAIAETDLTFNDLLSLVKQQLSRKFSGNIGW